MEDLLYHAIFSFILPYRNPCHIARIDISNRDRPALPNGFRKKIHDSITLLSHITRSKKCFKNRSLSTFVQTRILGSPSF
jgi:hypothetical protein